MAIMQRKAPKLPLPKITAEDADRYMVSREERQRLAAFPPAVSVGVIVRTADRTNPRMRQ
jgi:hypothetical protein